MLLLLLLLLLLFIVIVIVYLHAPAHIWLDVAAFHQSALDPRISRDLVVETVQPHCAIVCRERPLSNNDGDAQGLGGLEILSDSACNLMGEEEEEEKDR